MSNLIKTKKVAPDESDELYYILGVSVDASMDEIRKAYKKLANEYHPDKPGGDPKVFKLIKQAYDILIDPEKRQNYDATGIFAGIDLEKVNTARGNLESLISAIINNDSVDLARFDIVLVLSQSLEAGIKQSKKNTKYVTKKIARLNKHKNRAKVGVILSVFEKSIKQQEGELAAHILNKEVDEIALKIIKTCRYEFDTPPEPETPEEKETPYSPFGIIWTPE